ncbi:hypothetical protein [Aliiglaciecola litoralis]|uniref:DUF2306 domain-containing protein n=1 Tax=Aliiglaciecola litoralis TaxID=582857 RepID=A0ABP3WRP4_9ALTE
MLTLHTGLFTSHIFLGSLALILFWIPIFSRKGGLDHIKFGRYYGFTMYAVALSGALMALMVIYDPIALKGHLLNENSDQQNFIVQIRIFWGFLLFLSLLTYTSVRQGFAALVYKQNTQPLRRISHLAPLLLLLIGGLVMFGFGIMQGKTLHTVFGILGVVISSGMLRYCFNKAPKPKQWLLEHFGGMIGSGIGAYTAFIAFGGRRLFADLGSMQLVFWIAPGVIGSIAIYYLSRKYQTK